LGSPFPIAPTAKAATQYEYGEARKQQLTDGIDDAADPEHAGRLGTCRPTRNTRAGIDPEPRGTAAGDRHSSVGSTPGWVDGHSRARRWSASVSLLAPVPGGGGAPPWVENGADTRVECAGQSM